MAKKKHDPQAKAKRQKMIAAVGGVILLGLLAFQLPRTLKLLHPSNATASAAQAAPAPTTPAATPVGGAAASSGTAAATSADGLTDPGTAISPQSGQLLAFSRFRSKDPFAQQLKLDCATGQGGDCSSGTGTTSTGSGPGGSGGSGGGATGASGASGGGVTQPPGSGSPPAKPTSAQISVNGAGETVSVGAQFPASSPVFVLVALKRSSAKIAIAGGTLQGGGTVTLKKGRPLTLMNTADGTRYVLRLVSVS